MNRTVTTATTFEAADNHVSFYIDKSPVERLNHACHIINSIFNVNPNHKVNREITFARKHVK